MKTPKILVIAPSWIGDCVMAQPLFALLKQKYPDAVLDVMAPEWSYAVFNRMAEVDKILENPFKHGVLDLQRRYQIGKSLRTEGYTHAIILPGSFKSALIPFFAHIPVRIGFIGEMRYGFINQIHRVHQVHKMVERYAILADVPGTSLGHVPNPIVQVDAQQQASLFKKYVNNQPFVALCAGAEYGPAKRWPAHHFADLAQKLAAQNIQTVCFGSQKEAPIADEIIRLSGCGINLCGVTSLEESIDLLASSRAAVCNDSGLMHISAAVGIPLVAIYGSTSPQHTPPLSERAQVISLNLACSPCFKRTCPMHHTHCLEKISADRVFQSLQHYI